MRGRIINTAMILAAGRGERLKPLTDIIPKAMCRVHGRPLIEHHVVNLAAAGFTRLIINHAHLGDQIRRHLGDGRQWGVEILYSPEPPGGLETGGGIVNALSLLGNEPFMAVNADIFTNVKFETITFPPHCLAHLLLVKNPAHNPGGDFGLRCGGFISNNEPCYTYPGIAIYHPEAFRHFFPGRYSVVPMLRRLADEGLVTGEIFQGIWYDIGTSERLQQANILRAV